MRSESEAAYIDAARASTALFEAVQPFVNAAVAKLPPALPADTRAIVLLQQFPLMGRLIVVRPGVRAHEASRLTEPDLPGFDAIASALGDFIAGGLAALPEYVAAQALAVVAAPGAGFVVMLDPVAESARCIVLPKGIGLAAGLELFSIAREDEPVAPVTLH